jgi:hypothetical protein
MSRSAYAIATTAVGDLLAIQASFDNSKAILELIMQRVPSDSSVHALAWLGMADIQAWESKVLDWASMMDDELEDPSLTDQHNAYALETHRRALLKYHDTSKIS